MSKARKHPKPVKTRECVSAGAPDGAPGNPAANGTRGNRVTDGGHDNRSPGDLAVDLFNSGFNCAESAVQAILPFPQQGLALQRAATGFGGGIARHGLTCGAISGCAIAAGFLLGRTEAGDLEGKERAYRAIDALIRRFEERYGTIDCRRLTGFDFIGPHDIEEYNAKVKPTVCVPLLRFAVEVAMEEIRNAGLSQPAPPQAA
jgi:C_GCAxxG_C_C family probable redox protein